MTNADSPFLGRREMAKSALLGGASFLLGAQGPARAEGPPAGQEHLNVRDFGATGDGKTDDTKAIQRALDAAGEVQGAVFVPPGVTFAPNSRCAQTPPWWASRPGIITSRAERFCGSRMAPPSAC